MAKIAFSLLVHENPSIILEQVNNVLFFNPNSIIVLHFNPRFNENGTLTKKELFGIFEKNDRVIVNPNPVDVSIDNIIQGHLSNFKCIKDIDFDYFYLIASNEMFVNFGAESFVEKYDYGCEKIHDKNWFYYDKVLEDTALIKLYGESFEERVFRSQVEGSFYSKYIFGQLVSKIEEVYDYKKQSSVYPREELLFSTVACNDFADLNRYNGCLCYINWKRGLFLSIGKVKKVAKSSLLFSVKRVDRNKKNYLRQYIKFYLLKSKNVQDVFQNPLDENKKHMCLLKIHFINAYWKVFYLMRSFLSWTKHHALKR